MILGVLIGTAMMQVLKNMSLGGNANSSFEAGAVTLYFRYTINMQSPYE